MKKCSDLIEKQICDRQTQNLRLQEPIVGCARFQDLGMQNRLQQVDYNVTLCPCKLLSVLAGCEEVKYYMWSQLVTDPQL